MNPEEAKICEYMVHYSMKDSPIVFIKTDYDDKNWDVICRRILGAAFPKMTGVYWSQLKILSLYIERGELKLVVHTRSHSFCASAMGST